MYNLGVRAAEHLPYTYMGSVLIAVNPLQEIPLPSMSMYNDNAARQAVPPHPYALAGISNQLFQHHVTKCYVNIYQLCQPLASTN